MKKVISIALITAMVMTSLMVIACGGVEQKPPDQVTVQLKWIHQAQFAGFYAAEQKGFYAEENIDVTIEAGGANVPPDTMFADLVKGNSDFAITAGDKFLQARSDGEPLVAIAVIFQKNPYVYFSLKESGIQRPQDLVGKKIMVAPDGELLHTTLLRKLDIDPNTIELIPYTRDVVPLTTGQIDAHMVYRTGTGLAFDETGFELNVMWVGDYGIRGYADTIVVAEHLVQQNPELVERFLRATLKGWRYAIENQNEAVDMTLEYNATLARDRQVRMMAIQIPIIHTGQWDIGWMEGNIWQGTCDMLLEGGVMTRPINVTEAYTMQFLNKIYGKVE